MFSQVSVILSTRGAGGVHGRGGMCGRGHVWLGSMHGRGLHGGGVCAWQGCVWWGGGACMTGEMATAAESMHPTGMHSC